MKVKYHSMSRGCMVIAELDPDYEAQLREEWETLPHHNGFADFEDFVICVLSYND